jgi:hypothetical protein
MRYILFGIVFIVILIIVLKRMARKSNTPENIITFFYQALELEYFILNPKSTLEAKDLDKSLLTTSGYFYSKSKSVEVKMRLDEIISLASYAVEKYEQRADRLGFFIILFIVALSFKEKGRGISLKRNSEFLLEVDDFDGKNALSVMENHLNDMKAPVR